MNFLAGQCNLSVRSWQQGPKENGDFWNLRFKCKPMRRCCGHRYCAERTKSCQAPVTFAPEKGKCLGSSGHLPSPPAPRRPSAGAGSGSQPRCSAVGAVPMWRPRNRNGSVTLKGKCDFCCRCCQVYSWILAKQILAATWISIYPPAWQHLGIIATDCYISNTGSVHSVTWTSGGYNGINNPRNNTAKYHMP